MGGPRQGSFALLLAFAFGHTHRHTALSTGTALPKSLSTSLPTLLRIAQHKSSHPACSAARRPDSFTLGRTRTCSALLTIDLNCLTLACKSRGSAAPMSTRTVLGCELRAAPL
eukprot:109353-Rhodomonas_salina.2